MFLSIYYTLPSKRAYCHKIQVIVGEYSKIKVLHVSRTYANLRYLN